MVRVLNLGSDLLGILADVNESTCGECAESLVHAHDSGVCSSLESTDRHILVDVTMGAMCFVHDQENVAGWHTCRIAA